VLNVWEVEVPLLLDICEIFITSLIIPLVGDTTVITGVIPL